MKPAYDMVARAHPCTEARNAARLMSESESRSERVAGRFLNFEPSIGEAQGAQLEQWVNQHNEELVRYISQWVRSREIARDIVQESFLRMVLLGNPQIVGHLRAFLYQTAKNIAVDWLRKRIVREAFAAEEAVRAEREDLRTPDRICLAAEEVEMLERAFELLSPRAQMAVMLIRDDGLRYEEVGKRLGIKTHTARRLVKRAMDALHQARCGGFDRMPNESNLS